MELWRFMKRHKYLVVLIAFTIHVTFFDENNLITRFRNKMTISKLQKEISYYKHEYEKSSKMIESINEDPRSFEKIARERYMMKKDNEDIYIIKQK